MNRIIKRNVRFWFGLAAQSIGVYILMFLGIIGFQMLSFTGEQLEYYIKMMPYMFMWIGAIAFMAIRVSIYQVYFQQVLSFGSRRIEAFWGTQAMDIAIIVGISVLYIIIQKISVVLGYNMTPFSENSTLMLAGMFLAGGIGNFVGMLIIKFGKKGVIVFMLLCGFIGGCSGFAFSMLQRGRVFTGILVPSNLAVIGVCIAIVIYLLGVLLEYSLLKNYEVRV